MRWLVALMLLTCAGCPADDSDLLLFEERFEDPAAPGWTSNTPIVLASTIHPAEHALVASDGQILSHALGKVISDEFSDGLWLEYSSNCADPPELWLEQQPDLRFDVVVEAATEAAPPDEFERWYVSVPPVAPEPATLAALELRFLGGGGTCAIDNLRLYQPANITGF